MANNQKTIFNYSTQLITHDFVMEESLHNLLSPRVADPLAMPLNSHLFLALVTCCISIVEKSRTVLGKEDFLYI